MATNTLTTVFILCTALIVSSCENRASSLEVDPDGVEILNIEDNPTLYAFALDKNGEEIEDIQITWASSNPDVIAVDDSGVLTAKGTGRAVVTASADGLVKRVGVNVILCSELKVDRTELPLTIGQTAGITAQVLDEKGNPADCPVIWSVEHDSVAQVDEKGFVTGQAPGKTMIKVKTETHSAQISVEVTATANPMAATSEKIVAEYEAEYELESGAQAQDRRYNEHAADPNQSKTESEEKTDPRDTE